MFRIQCDLIQVSLDAGMECKKQHLADGSSSSLRAAFDEGERLVVRDTSNHADTQSVEQRNEQSSGPPPEGSPDNALSKEMPDLSIYRQKDEPSFSLSPPSPPPEPKPRRQRRHHHHSKSRSRSRSRSTFTSHERSSTSNSHRQDTSIVSPPPVTQSIVPHSATPSSRHSDHLDPVLTKGKTPTQHDQLPTPTTRSAPHTSDASSSSDPSSSTSTSTIQWKARTRWNLLRAFMETKLGLPSPFPKAGSSAPPKDERAVDALGQITEYAEEVRLRQSRNFVLSVLLHKGEFSVVLFDQAGVLVSEAVDFAKEPEKLFRFFYVLGQMNDEQLGLDPTVVAASPEECMQCRDHIPQAPARLRPRLRAAFPASCPLFKVTVPGDSVEEAGDRWEARLARKEEPAASPPVSLIIGRLAVGHRSATGRGTKCWIAYDLKTSHYAFLKDSWRTDYSVHGFEQKDAPKPEMWTYWKLKTEKVQYIADVLYGGDVHSPDGNVQRTRVHRYSSMLQPRIHTRLVQKQICLPLSDYKDSYELVWVVFQALVGMLQPLVSLINYQLMFS